MNDQLEFYRRKLTFEIDSWDLYESLEKEIKIQVIDTRSPEAYNREHIPGAINLPHRQMSEETVSSLDKEVPCVSYCDGIGCNGSTKGALKLTELGFQVRELMGGLDWWKRDGYETHGSEARPGTSVKCAC